MMIDDDWWWLHSGKLQQTTIFERQINEPSMAISSYVKLPEGHQPK
jgi:hypothetical protein